MRVRDLKGGAMFLFARIKRVPFAQGKNREPGLQENSVRNFTGRQDPIPGKIFRKPAQKQVFSFPGKQANCFACVGT